MQSQKCYIQSVGEIQCEVKDSTIIQEQLNACIVLHFGTGKYFSKKKPILFLIVQYIYQSQLAMVCFDFVLQISVGRLRHRSTERETEIKMVKLGEKGWLKKERAGGGRQWGRQMDKEAKINWETTDI